MIAFDEYLLLYLMPNTIVVVRETSHDLVVEHKYSIDSIKNGNAREIKMYHAGLSSAEVNILKKEPGEGSDSRTAILTVQNS